MGDDATEITFNIINIPFGTLIMDKMTIEGLASIFYQCPQISSQWEKVLSKYMKLLSC